MKWLIEPADQSSFPVCMPGHKAADGLFSLQPLASTPKIHFLRNNSKQGFSASFAKAPLIFLPAQLSI
ncbi:hypothetical protein [Amphritea japonica]|uniref:hypothetical protein n=1 Tax=Amphritea japonica TaxID=452627 RepID=UPI0003705AB1|nr:hypothetical protein [Amphritea japonica]